MPDGRIIAVGGEGAPGNEPPQSIIEAFSPPYLFRGIRPEIGNMDTTVFQRGGTVLFDVAKTNALTGVVLMSNAVLTHFMNSGNNRYLDLDFSQNGNQVSANLPTDSLQLMPGWYMLFGMVDDIPSVGKMIKIEQGLAPVVSEVDDERGNAFSTRVFPNPSHGQFNVEIKGATAGESLRLEVFDLSGRLLLQEELMASGSLFLTEITLPPGVFELKISGDNRNIQK